MTAPAIIRQAWLKHMTYARRVFFETEADGVEGYVYFVRPDDEPFFKVGWAKVLTQRLNELQVGNHRKLNLWFAVKTYAKSEKLIHSYLKPLRLHGEWFSEHDVLHELMFALEDASVEELVKENGGRPLESVDVDDIPLTPKMIMQIIQDLAEQEVDA